ncbi:gfo/Idh/MocA family oxidoreductase [bacterium]|nr:MAG: gfo/Idh/MocA family oxidoreductase [bacterium]
MPELRIGLIGLDTSHAPAFAKLLNDEAHPFHVAGAKIHSAFPGGSPDFGLSWNRVEAFTTQVRDESSVTLLDSPAAVAEQSDAIILTSVDGRVHLRQFQEIAPFKKPVFIDKPFAISSVDATAIAKLAKEHAIPLMSSSILRYGQPLVDALAQGEEILGADCSGPMDLEDTQPGLFWYGIHSVETLYAALGTGCRSVWAISTPDAEFVTGLWDDGRIGTVRGYRTGNKKFGALLHGVKESRFVDVMAHPKPAYAGLLERVVEMFQTGQAPIPIEETLEIVRFIEAANQSRESGESVML